MTMEIRDGRYVSQIYFLGSQAIGFDVMGFLYRDEGKPFELLYRFRYYSEERTGPWDEGDLKSWTHGESKETDELAAIAKITPLFEALAQVAGVDLTILPVQSDRAMEIGEVLMKQPWAHIKAAGQS